jgi:hypothetical protein
MWGGGQRDKKNLRVLHWALEAHVHKTTYGPLTDTAQIISNLSKLLALFSIIFRHIT